MIDKDRLFVDYLHDMLASIMNIESFLKDMDYSAFQEDIKTQYAVIRAFEIIGEASKKVPKEIKDNYSWIPWRLMAGLRDKLIHDYFGVDTQVIWNTAVEDILKLKEDIKKLLSDYSD